MRKTAKQLWEEAEEGTTFACQFIPTGGDSVEDEPEVVWTKGVVDDLDWPDVLWIQAIEYAGERSYK